MYVFSFSYTQTHTSPLCLLKWEKECYSTANCCRIQTQASTHCLPYRTSVCTKSKPVELFARITSSHRGKASFMHAKLTNFENHQIKWSLLSQNHTHPSDTTTFCLCVRIMLTHDWYVPKCGVFALKSKRIVSFMSVTYTVLFFLKVTRLLFHVFYLLGFSWASLLFIQSLFYHISD